MSPAADLTNCRGAKMIIKPVRQAQMIRNLGRYFNLRRIQGVLLRSTRSRCLIPEIDHLTRIQFLDLGLSD